MVYINWHHSNTIQQSSLYPATLTGFSTIVHFPFEKMYSPSRLFSEVPFIFTLCSGFGLTCNKNKEELLRHKYIFTSPDVIKRCTLHLEQDLVRFYRLLKIKTNNRGFMVKQGNNYWQFMIIKRKKTEYSKHNSAVKTTALPLCSCCVFKAFIFSKLPKLFTHPSK